MSVIEITSNGLTRKTYLELRSELRAEWIGIFGSAIDLSESSPDGHHIDVEATTISSVTELIQAVYANLTIDGCSGIWVDIFGSYRGITRLGAAYSFVNATFYGTSGTVVPAGTQIKVSGGSTYFVTDTDVTIGVDGSATVRATCALTGAYDVGAGAWVMVSSTPSVTVTVLTDGSIGRAVETDEAMKVRIKSAQINGLATVPAMLSYLQNNVSGNSGVSITENVEDETDSAGRPPHSVEVTIKGGVDSDIASKILYCKPAGIEAYGTHVAAPGYPATDTNGDTHYVNWSVPDDAYAWLRITINEYSEELLPTDYIAQIKAAVVAWSATEWVLGKDLIPQRVVVPIYNEVAGILFVTVLAGVSYSAGVEPTNFYSTRISVGSNYKLITDENKITVTLA